jgi:hypothetical protein
MGVGVGVLSFKRVLFSLLYAGKKFVHEIDLQPPFPIPPPQKKKNNKNKVAFFPAEDFFFVTILLLI